MTTDLSSLLGSLLPETRIASLPVRRYDVVIVGAGIAGLTFALRLPEGAQIALLTKGALGESNTRWAQGGLSAAIAEDDSPDLHFADTIAAGAGLCDDDAVRELVEGAPAAVEWLLSLDTHFDRDPRTGELLLGKEAAHSRRRVLHAGGDATGAEMERALVAAAKTRPNIDLLPYAFAIDLVVESGRCTGLIAQLSRSLGLTCLSAPVVAIAAGGAGQLWATTSNPAGATADGLAMALRAGVAVADAEFVQFHPTVLNLPGSAPFLISEAVRGEGAYLRDAAGERFMTAVHPLAELAPRDVVARGIQRQMAKDATDAVNLDLRHLDADAMHARFPTISRELAARGLDLARDLIPVAPAAHYFMGGIVAGTDGRTSLPGLLALGEASCTGVHGANRLASNSLLEGLVFGRLAAQRVERSLKPSGSPLQTKLETSVAPPPPIPSGDRVRLQRVMSADVAVLRDAAGLSDAAAMADDLLRSIPTDFDPGSVEMRNIATAARAVIAFALAREESRGAHFRADFPETDPAMDGKHRILQEGNRWTLGSLNHVLSKEI